MWQSCLMADQTWYRCFFRNGKNILVQGAAERDRIRARKVPICIHAEEAIIFECRVCGHAGPWTEDWYGYHAPGDRTDVLTFCSRDCWVRESGGFDIPHWFNVHSEPRHDRERNRALWDAKHEDGTRQRRLRDNRKVPLTVEWRGPGWCKWCGLIIRHTEGPNAGKQNKRRYWHPECVHEFNLHSRLDVQFRHLVERDGKVCRVCDQCPGAWHHGTPERLLDTTNGRWRSNRMYWPLALQNELTGTDRQMLGLATPIQHSHRLEVDHIVPLWSVAHLPDHLRQRYYGPDNIQLLCHEHHKEKTRREAAERARLRANS